MTVPQQLPAPAPGSVPMNYYNRSTPLVGVLNHPDYRLHDTGDHPENRYKIDRISDVLFNSSIAERVMRFFPRYATAEQIALVHEPKFIAMVERAAGSGPGWLDTDTRIGPGSYETALLAAGGVIAAVDDVMMPAFFRPDSVFAVVRPPGHHSSADRAMGFCIFNNVAIAARYAQQTYGIERVMIVDWDVHHGNGTNDIFAADPSVLFTSLHQWPLYPGTGWFTDVGFEEAAGTNVNIPVPPGAGDALYQAAFERIIEPIADQFRPDLILVSAGQDCHASDPLSDALVTLDGFQWMTGAVRRIADKHAQGRYVLALEGGYNQHALPWLVTGIAAAMGDLPFDHVDSFAPKSARPMRKSHEQRIQDVIDTLKPYWKLD
ncbi:MAG: histone deacetylase [Thermomicrobiales bacterium]